MSRGAPPGDVGVVGSERALEERRGAGHVALLPVQDREVVERAREVAVIGGEQTGHGRRLVAFESVDEQVLQALPAVGVDVQAATARAKRSSVIR